MAERCFSLFSRVMQYFPFFKRLVSTSMASTMLGWQIFSLHHYLLQVLHLVTHPVEETEHDT